jgi:hypothetical protein
MEEGDSGTLKAKQRLSHDELRRISQFRVTFQSRPD